MNTRILAVITTALSVALIIMLLWPKDDPTTTPDNTNRRAEDSLKAEISNRDAVIFNVREQKAKDSVQNVRVTTGLILQNKTLSKKLKEAEAVVPESPEFDRYVELVDSTNAVKDSLYVQAVNHYIALDSLFRIEVAALADKNVVQVKINQLLETKVADLTAQNAKLSNRLEGKKRGNKILAGIALGLGAAIGVISLTN